MDRSDNLSGAIPDGQVAQRIAAHQQEQIPIRVFLLEQAEAVNGVVRAGAVDFNGGKFEAGAVGQRATQHFEAMLQVSDRSLWFVRRLGS